MKRRFSIFTFFFLACGDSLTQEEEDHVARVVSGSSMSREELTDMMSVCQALIDCYQSDGECPDDTDLRSHMPRGTTTDWGRVTLIEFKNKGIRLMEERFVDGVRADSLYRADWPCRDFYQQYNARMRNNQRTP